MANFKIHSIPFMALAFCFATFAQAQNKIVIADSKSNIAYAEAGPNSVVPAFFIFKETSNVAPQMAFMEIASMWNMRNEDSWQSIRIDADDIGFNHLRYQQFYKGIKVEQGECIIHERNGRVETINGDYISDILLDVMPTVNKATALNYALTSIGATTYKWQVASEEAWHKQITNNPKATLYPKGELVIIRLHESKGAKDRVRLAWKFDVYAHQPHGRWFVYVDAHSGVVIEQIDRICEFVAPGIANTKYSGPQPIVADSLGPNNFRLRDYSRGANILTYDLNKSTNYGVAVDFTDNNNVWDSVTNQDNAAYDAHHGAEMTYDYYLSVHGRNSYNNLGGALISYIHYSNNYNNAFWNGSVMTYGDGNGTTFSPLTTIDICGHELTHGVTEYSSNLVYSYESGALNESFSDIFGTCVDFFAFPSTANWKLGEQCFTPGTPNDALRYLDNPNAASDPDTYLGTFWWTSSGDNGGVHTNSGVQNYWFYLLTMGGSGTNDVGYAYNVSGLGINVARLIAYRNNNFYLTSGSKYADARRYAIQSAFDLFGPCSNEMLQTARAWDAVGVFGTYNGNTAAVASNSGITCSGTAVNLAGGGGITYSWVGPNGFTSTLQNPTLNNIAIADTGTYTVTVSTATGCTGTASTIVVVHPMPTVNGDDLGFCPGVTGIIDANAAASGGGGPNITPSNPAIIPIPDNNQTGISSPIAVSTDANAIEIVSVEIDSIDHTWDADLSIYLRAPNGSEITLASGVGGSGDNFDNTIFAASATNVIGSAGNNTAPFNGTYAPMQPFTNLSGSANGTWLLRVVDPWNLDAGSLRGWRLTISSFNVITSYAWSPATGLSSTSIAMPDITISSSTTYTVQVTDARGCTGTGTILATALDTASVTATASNIVCGGTSTGTITATPVRGTAPFVYALNGGGYSTNNTFNNLAAGTYAVRMQDFYGCNISTYTVTVTQNAPLTASSSLTNNRCYGGKSGVINLTPNGGTLPYGFLWSNSRTTEDLNNLVAGAYTCTITDANGCTKQHTRTITQPAQITMTFTKNDATSPNFNNGDATCTPANGFTPYRYTWNTSPSQTTQTATGLVPGTYVVTVKDNKKCARNGSVTIIAARFGLQSFTTNDGTVMPNPGHGLYSINYAFDGSEIVDARVYAMNGALIKEYRVLMNNFSSGFEIDIREMPAGIYLLEIQSAQQKTVTKIIKQ